MKAKSLDKKFDDNKENIVDEFDLSTIRRPNQTQKESMSIYPLWMIESLDKESGKSRTAKEVGLHSSASCYVLMWWPGNPLILLRFK